MESFHCSFFNPSRELRGALREVKEVRVKAIRLLRDLLAKHSYDDRYSTPSQRARLASLYLPLIQVILENKQRFFARDHALPHSPEGWPHETPGHHGGVVSPDDSVYNKRASFNGEGFDVGQSTSPRFFLSFCPLRSFLLLFILSHPFVLPRLLLLFRCAVASL